MSDKRLEGLSDKIRRGSPVSISEAIQAIEYQAAIRKQRAAKETLFARIIRWVRGKYTKGPQS